MTNHWADMANSTNVVVMGANPVENHPASIAHINKPRAAGGTGSREGEHARHRSAQDAYRTAG